MAARAQEAWTRETAFLDRYELLEKIGQGGFGCVYKARQRTTGQTVAIKVLQIGEGRSQEQIERLAARFQREMRLCAELHHPNIVRLIDSGNADDRTIYSVFEFIPGKNLATVLAAERCLQPIEARHLMVQILDALACAHAQGVVHRDLKPENIMVVPTGARRNAVVLDFGIGAVIEANPLDDTRLTRSHEWVGTPVYAAPEQIRGQRPTPSADLYAWGLIFLESLTGKRVVQGTSAADVVFQQLSSDPIPIPEQLAAHPLGHILKRVTAKDPRARDTAADRLLRELEACDVRGLRFDAAPGSAPRVGSTGETATMEVGSDVTTPTGASSVEDLPMTGVRPIEGERRQITAVCCALSVVSEAPGDADVDVDELDPILSAEQSACTAIARRFGGYVGGALSDAMLFLFGYPSAREDDAQRAARAALAMVVDVQRRSALIAARDGVRVNIRAGVHSGLIVTRDLGSAGDITSSHLGGMTPRVATRLSAQAEPGEVLVSSETYRLLRGRFAFDARSALTSADAQVSVYRLREDAPGLDAQDTPVIGRDRELDALLERWGKARGGAGQAVLITGEPGIGKSRLTRALRGRLGEGAHTYVEGRCAQDATNSPLFPIVDMLDRALDPGRELSPEARAEQCQALLSRHGFDLAETMPLFTALLSLPLPAPFSPPQVSPQKQWEMTHSAVLSLLFEMGERAPVVLLVEDLHWADPSTLQLCASLVSEIASGRILAVFTGRPEFSPPWSPSAALTVQLEHLERSSVGQMVAAVAGGRALPPEVVDRIAARTDGVPLFVEEVVQTMLESGALVEKGGALVLARALDDVSIPSTLRSLLAARLDRLGGAKETAQVAAAIGREFSVDLLCAALPADEGALREDLERLVGADLVHRKRRLRSATYVWKHALVQDAAYDSMVKSRRREIHERIARALERQFSHVIEEQPEVAARHFEQAGLVMEASVYLLRAAQHAMQRSAFIEATALLTRGVDLIAREPAGEPSLCRELELRTVLGGALASSRGYTTPEFEENGLRARALCGMLGNRPEQFPVVLELWAFNVVRGDRAATEGYSSELLAVAEVIPSSYARLSAYHARGVTLHYSQRNDEASEWLRRAIACYDPKEHVRMVRTFGDDPGVMASAYLQHVELYRGDFGEALRCSTRTRALVEELEDPPARAVAALFAMIMHHLLGDYDRMAEMAEEAMALTRKHGLYHWQMLTQITHGLALVRRGDVEAGLAQAQAGLAYIESNKHWAARMYWVRCAVEAWIEAGRGAETLELIESTIEGATGKLDQGHIPSLLGQKAGMQETAGDRAAAIATYERALEMATGQSDRLAALGIARRLARAAAPAPQRAGARARLAEALSKIRGGEGQPEYEDAARLLAALQSV